jgi:NitT/TauT family transport system substrate-binding protein
VFADKAFYAIEPGTTKGPVAVPFLLKKDAEAHAAKAGGKFATYAEALSLVGSKMAVAAAGR